MKYLNSKQIHTIANCLILFVVILIVAISNRAFAGNLDLEHLIMVRDSNTVPSELTRYALLYSLAEDHSFQLSIDAASLALPDLGYYDGNFVSLFAPGLSLIATPGYIIGKFLGGSQVGAFGVIGLFAILNFVLIRAISKKLYVDDWIANICALTFIFATNAFSYGVSFYQHHISTFLILIAVYALIALKPVYALLITWVACVIAVMVDYPNFFIMFPIGVYALSKIISVKYQEDEEAFHINVNFLRVLTVLIAFIPIMVFGIINHESYGSPFSLAGTVTQVKSFDYEGLKDHPESANFDAIGEKTDSDRSAVGFFMTRDMLRGAAILFISPDRGIVYYTPIMILGLFGFFILYKKPENIGITNLFLAIVLMNVILYSMWGDPWGGWAFGPRYLIPSFAIISIVLGAVVQRFYKNAFFVILFVGLFAYSSFVSTVGALTTNIVPPQVEVLELEARTGVVQKYTYARNIDMLNLDDAKSIFFVHFAKQYLSAWEYFAIIYALILLVSLACVTCLVLKKRD